MKENKETTIAVIVCYLGKLPWYFDFYIHSCKFNPTVNFFVITDDTSYQKALPGNVEIIIKSMEEINILASEKLGVTTQICFGYKVNDFKPAYGVIFSELLEGFDFWAHGDIDIIYGNIRKFITEEVLSENDLIVVRDDILTGYFLLFRNTPLMVNLFKESRDYVKVFTNEKHFCFDETNFRYEEFKKDVHFSQINSEIESMNHLVKRLQEERKIKVYFDFHVIEGTNGHLVWDKGTLMYKNKYEVLLFHMIHFKNRFRPQKIFNYIPEKFWVSSNRIYW